MRGAVARAGLGIALARLFAPLFALSFALPAPAGAQAYPTRPIRFVSPQPPGGTFDYVMRAFAERLQGTLGQPLVIEHHPGAGTQVGLAYTAKQPPDGHTLVLSSTAHAILPALSAAMPFDPVAAFEPVSLVALTPFVLAVRADSGAQDVAGFIALARARPGALTFGSSGVGTPLHFGGEMLKAMAGVELLHVPYKGAAAVVNALLAGEVSASFAPAPLLLSHLKAGRLRALGHLGSGRAAALPGLPNIGDTVRGYALDSWFGVMGPAGMPRAVVERLNTEFNRVARDPQFVAEKLAPAGLEAAGSTPGRLREVLVADIARFAKIARDAGIRAD